MEQYHQYLFKVVASEATQDQNGNWSAAEGDTIEYVSKCRLELSGKASEINSSDGTHTAYSGIVYTPATTWRPSDGQAIIVASDRLANDIVMRLIIVSTDNGRLHNRIWVR